MRRAKIIFQFPCQHFSAMTRFEIFFRNFGIFFVKIGLVKY